MKYQLVLQWPATTIKDYDAMIWIEEALVKGIGNIAIVDGHDVGSGEVNIFLFTDHPEQAFEKIKRILGSRDFTIGLRVAFRERAGSEYQPLWPAGLTSFSIA